MLNKRIAGIVAGTALAATTVIAPQVSAQPTTIDDRDGTYVAAYWWPGPGQSEEKTAVNVFVPNGMRLLTPADIADNNQSHNKCYIKNSEGTEAGLKRDVLTEVPNFPGYYTVDEDCLGGSYVPVVPTDPETSSDAAGSAVVGLSALAGSALLSSGSSVADGSSPEATPPVDTDGPATGPVANDDPKADAQQAPATGPVANHDPKAAAQAQAANAPARTAPAQQAAPAAHAPSQVAQKQLANTGVEGTLVALAAGLMAAVAGASLLLWRRRA